MRLLPDIELLKIIPRITRKITYLLFYYIILTLGLSTCERRIFTLLSLLGKLFDDYFTFNLLSEIFNRKPRDKQGKNHAENRAENELLFCSKRDIIGKIFLWG